MTKRRIKNKHAHHEEVLRNKIELEVKAKYINRIDYLVGANNATNSPIGWMIWGPLIIGPHRIFWEWKKKIDRGFINSVASYFAPQTSQLSPY